MWVANQDRPTHHPHREPGRRERAVNEVAAAVQPPNQLLSFVTVLADGAIFALLTETGVDEEVLDLLLLPVALLHLLWQVVPRAEALCPPDTLRARIAINRCKEFAQEPRSMRGRPGSGSTTACCMKFLLVTIFYSQSVAWHYLGLLVVAIFRLGGVSLWYTPARVGPGGCAPGTAAIAHHRSK